MTYPDHAYFLTLAQISIAFVAFTSLVVVLRQTRGGALTLYERVAMTFNIETGFTCLWFAMLPPLFGLPQDYAAPGWRFLSGLCGVYSALWYTYYLMRRRRALGPTMPARIVAFSAVTYLLALWLMLDAAGLVFIDGVSAYAVVGSVGLAISCVGFVLTLPIFFEAREGA